MSLGFSFVLDCDWVLVTSREAVREGVIWNTFLRDSAAHVLIWLLIHDEHLRMKWASYLPRGTAEMGPWWREFCDRASRQVQANLAQLLAVSSSADVRFRLPCQPLLSLFGDWSREAGIVIVEGGEDLQEYGLRVLSAADYIESLPDDSQLDCGEGAVRARSGADPLLLLKWMQAQSDEWWQSFFSVLREEVTRDAQLMERCRHKPIFICRSRLDRPCTRQFCSLDAGSGLVVWCSDKSLRLWRDDIVIVDGRSAAEEAILQMSLVRLTPTLLIEYLGRLHLKPPSEAGSSIQIWRDLDYIRSHWASCNATLLQSLKSRLLVPSASEALIPVHTAILPHSTWDSNHHASSSADQGCFYSLCNDSTSS